MWAALSGEGLTPAGSAFPPAESQGVPWRVCLQLPPRHWALAILTMPCLFLGLGTAVRAPPVHLAIPSPQAPLALQTHMRIPTGSWELQQGRELLCLRRLPPPGCIRQASLIRAGPVCGEAGSEGPQIPRGEGAVWPQLWKQQRGSHSTLPPSLR